MVIARALPLLALAPLAAGQSLTLPTDRAVEALDADGAVVLSDASSGGVSLWTPGSGWTDLGGPTTEGRGVSRGGAVVIAGNDSTGGHVWRRGAGWSPMPGPGAPVPFLLSADGGRVLARSGPVAIGIDYFLVDPAGGPVSTLQLPPGGAAPIMRGISGDGSVVVGDTLAGPDVRATYWDGSGAATLLEPFSSNQQSLAYGVSENGQWIVGRRGGGAAGWTPVRWTPSGGFVALPTLVPPSAQVFQSPRFVSDDGATVAGDFSDLRIPTFENTAFISYQGGPALRFRDLLISLGGPDLGASIVVRGMSADGQRFLVEADGRGHHVDLDAVVTTAYCGPAVPNSTGAAATLVGLGSDVAADRFFVLRASSLPPSAVALPIVSRTQGLFPGAGGSMGTLCLGGSIGRLPIRFADASGAFDARTDTGALPMGAGTVAAAAGETWTFQAWYRDQNSSNFTDAAEVLFR